MNLLVSYNVSIANETETKLNQNDVPTYEKMDGLQPFLDNFSIKFRVISKPEPREVSNRNDPDEIHHISDITVADETGNILYSAWDEDIDMLEEGEHYELVGGFVSVYRNSLRLTRGREGELRTTTLGDFTPDMLNSRSAEFHERRRRKGKKDRF